MLGSVDSVHASLIAIVATCFGSACYSPPDVLDLLTEGDASSSSGTAQSGQDGGESAPHGTSRGDDEAADGEVDSDGQGSTGPASADESGDGPPSESGDPSETSSTSGSDDTTGGICQPQCGDRVCGVDPECSQSCGTCDPGASCLDEGLWCGIGLGYADDFGFSGSVNPNVLFGHRITVAPASTLRRFGVISGGTGTARLVLYGHDGTGPSTLIAASDPLTLAAGNNHIDVEPTALAAGTYWLGILLQSNASLRRTAVGDTGYELFYAVTSYDAPFPAELGIEEIVNDFRYNLYIVVESD